MGVPSSRLPAQLHDGLLFIHPLRLQNVLPLRLNRRLCRTLAACPDTPRSAARRPIVCRRILLWRPIARVAFRARSGRVDGRRGIARRHASARRLGALSRPAAKRAAHHRRRLIFRLVVRFIRRHQRVAVVVFDVRCGRFGFVLFFVFGWIREIAVVDGPVRTLRSRIGDGVCLVVVFLGVSIRRHIRLDSRFFVRRLTVRVGRRITAVD